MKITIAFACLLLVCVPVDAKRKNHISGLRAIVVDDRISALRSYPDARAPIKHRLHKGRRIGIIQKRKNKSGIEYFRVSISRNTQGWIMADAVSRPGNLFDAGKLISLIKQTQDEYTKIMLAQICISIYQNTEFATTAFSILSETADGLTREVTRDAVRRMGNLESMPDKVKREYILNHSGLDRYNRIGVVFDYDPVTQKIFFVKRRKIVTQ